MLYVTTRGTGDAFTAHRSLLADRAPDGGLYIPFKMPQFSREDILALKDKSYGQCIADFLNICFGARLSAWDVDFAIGRNSCKLESTNYRIIFAQTWHNQESSFRWALEHLAARLLGEAGAKAEPADWTAIAIRIGALFGIYGQLLRQGLTDVDQPLDIAVPVGDFSIPMAAWYAREMGLPIGTILCAFNDNGAAWELLRHGQLHTDASVIKTQTPECDHSLPKGLERLISGTLGAEEAVRYGDLSAQGKLYELDEENAARLSKGMFAGVVSDKRMRELIRSVHKTNAYLLDPYSALAYGTLQDYRAKTGTTSYTLILSDKSPACSLQVVSGALGISPEALVKKLGLE